MNVALGTGDAGETMEMWYQGSSPHREEHQENCSVLVLNVPER